ncbi:MAG: hypothetical protein IJ203_10760 [Atopobiaceae bacterium]|nr:hypothetical protein [Atopobiaceae bacterium]
MVITVSGVLKIDQAPNPQSIGNVQIGCQKPCGSGCFENLYMYGFPVNREHRTCTEFQVLSESRHALAGITVTRTAKDRLYETVTRITHTWEIVDEAQRTKTFGTDIGIYVLLITPGKLYSIGDDPSVGAIRDLARELRLFHPRMAVLLQELANQI